MSALSQEFCCRLLHGCMVAYEIKQSEMPTSDANYAAIGIEPSTTPKVFSDGPEFINAGFVGETFDGWVIVVFRGTLTPHMSSFFAWVDDWLNDFRVGPMPWTVGGDRYGLVETGFGSSVLDMWPFVKSSLASIDIRAKKGIVVSGHSKGGGMTFPCASLIKAQYPDCRVEVAAFAAPLTCDRQFKKSYESQGLDALTVRYQNQFDVVPFVPLWPHLLILSRLERDLHEGGNKHLHPSNLPNSGDNYVRCGSLRFLGDGCEVLTGKAGQEKADEDIRQALEKLEFDKIAKAHSAGNRYFSCVCGAP